MATKKCANGHLYDSSIYGDKCPFCPSSDEHATKVVNEDFVGRTKALNSDDTLPTEPIDISSTIQESHTIVHHKKTEETGKRLVGFLVSYSSNSCGEVFKVYEGRTTIGRDQSCDISFPNDGHMSSKHLLIQYVEAKGVFRAQEYDKGSANGTFVNGQVYVLGDVIDLKDKDVIIMGSTKLLFMTIPEF